MPDLWRFSACIWMSNHLDGKSNRNSKSTIFQNMIYNKVHNVQFWVFNMLENVALFLLHALKYFLCPLAKIYRILRLIFTGRLLSQHIRKVLGADVCALAFRLAIYEKRLWRAASHKMVC